MKKSFGLAVVFWGLGISAQASPFSGSCDNGALAISIGQDVPEAGGSGYIPVDITVSDGAIGNFFTRSGYKIENPFQTSLTPLNPYNAEINSYSIYDSTQATRWEFVRAGNGLRVEAWPNAGDPRQPINWYYQNCNF